MAYADGTQEIVYVRINTPWAEEWDTGAETFDNFVGLVNPWGCNVWFDWFSVGSQDTPYVAGQIVECYYDDPYNEPQEVTNVFYKQ